MNEAKATRVALRRAHHGRAVKRTARLPAWGFLLTLAITSTLRAGETTIVAFGDSTTAPRKIDSGELPVYADLLRAELPKLGLSCKVLNKGVGGHSTRDGAERFERDVLAEKPGVVIIQFGINDSTVNVWKTPPETVPPVSLDAFTRNITSMVKELKARHASVILMTPNPMRWTAELVGYYGKKPYDPHDPMGLNVTLVPYADAVRKVAADEGVELVDVFKLFCDHGQREGHTVDELLLDGMHPNAEGHRLVADAIERVMKPSATQPANHHQEAQP